MLKRKKLSIEEKSRILVLREQNDSNREIGGKSIDLTQVLELV